MTGMRLVLALDTATEEVCVGLGAIDGGAARLLGEINLDVPRASLTHLLPAVARLLESVGRSVREVDAVVVGRGPGSFTGVRIGVASAKGLAQGLGVPLYAVGTLDAIAERHAERTGLVGVVGDAMRREVYPALFRCSGGVVERLAPDTVASPAEVAAVWAASIEEPVLLAGNGLRKYADVFSGALGERAVLAPEASWTPTGESLLLAAARALAAGDLRGGDPATVLPVYTRLADAEETERSRMGLSPLLPGSGVVGPADAGGAS
jgi:bifunctional N6-L-threonylcarbamoyladenine synthase / protein kinase Bud32